MVDASHEIENQIEHARTLEDIAAVLATLLAGSYRVGRGGTLSESQRTTSREIFVAVFMAPHVEPIPHIRIVARGMDVRLSVIDGKVLSGNIRRGEKKLITWWLFRFRPMLLTAWETGVVVDDALGNLFFALRSLPWTPADEFLRSKLVESAKFTEASFLSAARGEDGSVTPGAWGLCISVVIAGWRKSGAAAPGAIVLPVLLRQFPVASDPQAASLVGHVVECLFLLHWEVSGELEDDRDAVVEVLNQIADRMAQLSRVGVAANLSINAAMLGRPGRLSTEVAARNALKRASESANLSQTTWGNVLLAITIVAASAAEVQRRGEAVDAVEQAIDALGRTTQPPRREFAMLLYRALSRDPAFEAASRVIAPFMAAGEVSALAWQRRVQRIDPAALIERIRSMYGPASPWFAFDDERASLIAVRASGHAQADWTHWTVDHPAYRSVIPHRRSFLREKDFDQNVLVLTHELTHVLSFLGGAGLVLACLRTAALATELALWVAHGGPEAERNPLNQLTRHGFAPLGSDRIAAALPDVTHGLGLHRKAQLLQDVWAPWFEGLAVFGETSGDPMHESAVIDPVNGALGNLIDVPTAGKTERAVESNSRIEDFRSVIDEFQQRSGVAVREQGAKRLSLYLRQRDSPYWIGYMVVRSVVSRWRQNAGQHISGTQAFRVLLHATRYDIEDVLPDLSLDVAEFARVAQEGMLAWVRRLAGLSAGEIDLLIRAHSSDIGATTVKWEQGRPVLMDASSERASNTTAVRLRKRMAEALKGSSVPTDKENTAIPGVALGDLARHANQSILLGSFLPIGRCDALFHLGIDPASGHGYLIMLIRTTDAHVDGGSSLNLFGITLSSDSAEALAKEASRTGASRIQVTRVIDLGGLACPESGVAGLHLLAYRLGDWFELRGATDTVTSMISAKAGRAAELSELVQGRLFPRSLAHVERAMVAVPELAGARAIKWLHGSTQSSDDAECEPLQLREQTKALAMALFLHSGEPGRVWPLASLAHSMFSDQAARRLVSVDFETLTQEAPDARDAIVAALVESGRGDGETELAEEAALALRACGCHILVKQAHGWDVVTT